MADRDSILDSAFSEDGMEDACREITTKPYKAVQNAMDTYMRESVLEAFEYVVRNCDSFQLSNGQPWFKTKNGEWLSKEELFENFL